ncbi:MAG: hypothetical protein U0Z26_10210 [Anaerolineales bacterium]
MPIVARHFELAGRISEGVRGVSQGGNNSTQGLCDCDAISHLEKALILSKEKLSRY